MVSKFIRRLVEAELKELRVLPIQAEAAEVAEELKAGIGGSGIVVIKGVNPYKCVGATNKYCFKYSGIFNVIDSDKDTWKIKFLTSGTFTPYFDSHVLMLS